jgi:hypothetical protein
LQEIVDADAVLLGLLEAAQRLVLAREELVDAGGLFEKSAPIGRLRGEDRVDLSLRDDRVGTGAESRSHQQFDHVAQPDALAVDEEFALARAVSAARDLHFARVDLQRAVFVIEREHDLGHAERLAPFVAGEDHVFHLIRAQRLRALLAEHPTDRVDEIGLAGSVRTHERGNAGLEHETRLFCERLESEEA